MLIGVLTTPKVDRSLTIKFEPAITLEKYVQNFDIEDCEIIKELTYEDWKKDQIPNPRFFDEKGIRIITVTSRDLHKVWSREYASEIQTVMSEYEVEKIKHEQIRVYKLAVKLYVEALVVGFEATLARVPGDRKLDLINAKIVIFEEKLDNETKIMVLEEILNHEIITPSIRKRITSIFDQKPGCDEAFTRLVLKLEDDAGFGFLPYEGLFAAHINYAFIKKLREFKDDFLNSDLTNKIKKGIYDNARDKKEKNVQPYLNFMMAYQRNRERFEFMKNTTVIEKIFEEEGFREEEFPTNRTLSDWIEDHRHEFPIEKIDELINIFVWEKFKPKTHDKKMIEAYLKAWEQNKGLSHFRKVTVDELKLDYPELVKISGSVIGNWEDQWVKFRDARTEN